jgi:hypothetical protein
MASGLFAFGLRTHQRNPTNNANFNKLVSREERLKMRADELIEKNEVRHG